MSRSWVRYRGSADPDFAARVKATVAAATERLRTAGSIAPTATRGAQGGEELVVRGGNGRLVQVRRARLDEWTPRVEDRFFGVLTATCNVKAACRAVGMSPAAAYYHYNRWDGFAKRWDAALAAGYDRLELALVENACRSLGDAPDCPPDIPIEPMSFEDALRLLRLHTGRARYDKSPRIVRDETIAQMMKQLAAKRRAGLLGAADGDDAARQPGSAAGTAVEEVARGTRE